MTQEQITGGGGRTYMVEDLGDIMADVKGHTTAMIALGILQVLALALGDAQRDTGSEDLKEARRLIREAAEAIRRYDLEGSQ